LSNKIKTKVLKTGHHFLENDTLINYSIERNTCPVCKKSWHTWLIDGCVVFGGSCAVLDKTGIHEMCVDCSLKFMAKEG